MNISSDIEDIGQSLESVVQPAAKSRATSTALLRQVPDSIVHNAELNACIAVLPQNYNLELHKTIWRIQELFQKKKCHRVALQFPEGLLMYSCVIADIIERFCPGVEVVIMGDVTYGACCIDDYTASALGCDLLVHYGHSCLVPVTFCKVNTLYVFVDIKIDVDHFIESAKLNFPKEMRVALISTIQYAPSLRAAKPSLDEHFINETWIPQSKPLSPGEVLGCTAPHLENRDAIVYIGDGRFHLEAMMIANPDLAAFRYNPFSKELTREHYDILEMRSIRKSAIDIGAKARKFGIVLGTLGRQGSTRILRHLEGILQRKGIEYVVILLSEIFPAKLSLFEDVDAWIQIACPRLSIDWGYAFAKPLLTPYEAEVALGAVEWLDVYPMDFYAEDGGEWTVKYGLKKQQLESAAGASGAKAATLRSIMAKRQQKK